MSIKRAKSFDRLYDELEVYDRVVVPDRPYARAINRHLGEPRFGPFAATPRQLAVGERRASDDRLAFIEVVDRVDLPWKQAAHLVGEVLQCWEHQGTADAILAYDGYDTAATRAVVETMTAADTRAARLQETVLAEDLEVAVVGHEQLTTLQRSILPSSYDTVDPFGADGIDHLPFRLVASSTAMVDLLLDTVETNDPADIAVVVEEGSRYATLVEAAFEAADIPYFGGPGFTDDPDVRAVMRLCRLAHAGAGVTVGEVRPVLARMGEVPGVEHDHKRLSALTVPEAGWIRDTLAAIPSGTLDDAVGAYESATCADLAHLTDELDRLGIRHERAGRETVDRLTFYLQSFDIPVDREESGVTLASATAAGFVDRPLVCFIGLDQGWTREAPARPWVDADRFFQRDLDRFQRLLQSGTAREYLVQDAVGGDPVVPCLYFDAVLDEPFDRFGALSDADPYRPVRRGPRGFDVEPPDTAPTTHATLSQSSLNHLVHSPRDYAFSRLVNEPEAVPLEEGTLVHDFAEFAVANPAAIDADRIEAAVEVMAARMAPFYPPGELEVRETTYHAWLEAVWAFVRERPPTDCTVTVGEASRGANTFAEAFDEPVESTRSERWFEDDRLGIKGKIDLVHGDGHLVDFKRSTSSTAKSIVSAAATDPPDRRPNYQAPLYLTYLRDRLPDRHLRFSFLYLQELVDGVLTGDLDLDEAITTVEYHPVDAARYLRSEAAFRSLVEDGYADCCKTFEQITFEDYRRCWTDLAPPDPGDDLDVPDLREPLTAMLTELVGEYAYVENGARQALRHLTNTLGSTLFADDLDRFETFVADRLDEVNRYYRGEERFPVRGLVEELDDRRLNHPDLLLDHA